MPTERETAAEIARIALQYRALGQEGDGWSGGPVSPDTLKQVARTVAQSLDAGSILRSLEASESPEEMLHGLLAVLWAQGFNVGAMYTENQGAK